MLCVQPSIRDYNKLPTKLQQYADSIVDMGKKVSLVVQEEQLGLGHAVLTAKECLAMDKPFVLMLGDHLYKVGACMHGHGHDTCES